MKVFRFLPLLLSALVFVSCTHTSEPPLYIEQDFTQLNTVIAPWQKDNDLLPWGDKYIMVINSRDDVYATQTERFIEENPNWLNVDFSRKSIVAYRYMLLGYDYWSHCAVLGFSRYNGEADYIYSDGDYIFNIQECYTYNSNYTNWETVCKDESQYRFYQVAIVTDKLPADANVHVISSTNIKAPADIWD